MRAYSRMPVLRRLTLWLSSTRLLQCVGESAKLGDHPPMKVAPIRARGIIVGKR